MSTRFDVWGRRVEAQIQDKTVRPLLYTYSIRIGVSIEVATQKLHAFLVDRIFVARMMLTLKTSSTPNVSFGFSKERFFFCAQRNALFVAVI